MQPFSPAAPAAARFVPTPAAARFAPALAAALFMPALAARAATPLTDAELSAIRGQDASIVLPVGPVGAVGSAGPAAGAAVGPPALVAAFGAAFADPKVVSTLDAAQFAAALADAGLALRMVPGYDGQPVRQYRIAMRPATFAFDAGELLQAATGLGVAGASMGGFATTDFDASGTTVWSWMHR
jgi:hypothetical protein